MTATPITIVSFGTFEKKMLSIIASNVSREYGSPVVMKELHLDLAAFFDPARRQYNGNGLLQAVDQMTSDESGKVIGLFSVDLFIPILTFMFGQAYLGGRSAIASRYRLGNELYGLPRDENLMISRLVKVVIHELGHAHGLVHCYVPECVMRAGTYVEDIDQKGTSLCHKCREILGIHY